MKRPDLTNGFTLPEMLVSIAISAVLLAIAVPSFQNTLEKRRLKSAAEQIYSDLQFARSEVLKRGSTAAGTSNIFVAFQPAGGALATTWCYGLNLNATCNCITAGACQLDATQKVGNSVGFRGVSLAQNFGSGDVAFDSRRGRATGLGGTVRLVTASKEVDVVVSAVGRVNICSPAGAANITDYPSC